MPTDISSGLHGDAQAFDKNLQWKETVPTRSPILHMATHTKLRLSCTCMAMRELQAVDIWDYIQTQATVWWYHNHTPFLP